MESVPSNTGHGKKLIEHARVRIKDSAWSIHPLLPSGCRVVSVARFPWRSDRIDARVHARPPMRSRTGALIAALFAGLGLTPVYPETPVATPAATEVAVVYSRRIPESQAVAHHYATLRGIPTNQLIEIEVPAGEIISRQDFERRIEAPIRTALTDRRLLQLNAILRPATPDRPGGFRYTCSGGSVRYLVMTWGLPYRIAPDSGLRESTNGIPPALQRNEACVDNELALLPAAGSYALTGPLLNRLAYGATNPTVLRPSNQLLMVTRLDGPTPALARQLVDRALQAERDGVWGRAYFDLRSITGDYAQGDAFITNAAVASRIAGLEVDVDTLPETLPLSYPLSHVALYAGWYAYSAEGPFARPDVEFVPGAIAYHLHSFSAMALRSTNQTWAGPFIARGATATLGCTDEPYLTFTPNVGIFVSRILAGWTWGEAAYASLPALSWQTIILGDPLYRPYARPIESWLDALPPTDTQRLPWAIVRSINLQLNAGTPANALLDRIRGLPLARQSSVLQEKLASLALLSGSKADAIRHLESAAALPASENQLMRILTSLGDLQTAEQQTAAAYATYERLLHECHRWVDQGSIRRRQLPLATALGRRDDVAFLQREIERLRR